MTLAVAITMLAAGAAYADTVTVTNDVALNTNVTKDPGSTGTGYVRLDVTNGTPAGDQNGCNANGANPLIVSLASDNADVSLDAPGQVTIVGCGIDVPFSYQVSATAAAGTAHVSVSALSGGVTSGTRLYLTTDTLTVTIAAPANTPPSAPGKPAADETPNQGAFSLSWDASTDDGNPNPPATVTYTLQHKDADDASFSTVAAGLAANAYTFTSGAPEGEGTWTYRVQASDGTLTSPFSPVSDPVVVDRTAPNAPAATLTGTAFTVAGTDWYKDTVLVTFSGSTDPALPDGSAGSGVASYSGPDTFVANGANAYSGTATDAAGNVSDATTGTVHVDSANPTAAIVTPSGSPVYLLGSTHLADYSCADAGGSGVASCSGLVGVTPVADGDALPTASVGAYSLNVTATDNVGHSGGASASYSVIYDFTGFFRPIDNLPTLNTVKAGQAIPVKFSLNGDQGLGIFATGFPTSKTSTCAAAAGEDLIEETVTAGGSSLSYDAASDQYVYVWKTDKSWAGTCRTLTVKLIDGTIHQALFKLNK